MESRKVVAVIPCYKEVGHIGDIVKSTLSYVDAVVVADDHSMDGTKSEATAAGATVVQPSLQAQRGVGNCTWCGIWCALKSGADIIVTLDGDGQHDPADIPPMLMAIDEGADIVVGSRMLNGATAMPKFNRVGNVILTTISNIGARRGQKVTDNQCGFRAFRADVFKHVRTTETQFGFIVETIIRARKAGLAVAERPVKCIYNTKSWPLRVRLSYAMRGISLAIQTLRWIIWERSGV